MDIWLWVLGVSLFVCGAVVVLAFGRVLPDMKKPSEQVPTPKPCVCIDGKDSPDNPPTCYSNGKQHGQWEIHLVAYGTVSTGHYVDGKKNWLWEIRLPYGSVEIGHYVNGERHGVWEIQEFNGPVHTGRFVNDNQHGKWVGRWPDDRKTVTTCYEHGIAHGKAERRFAGGEVQISRFVDGKMVEFDGKPVDE